MWYILPTFSERSLFVRISIKYDQAMKNLMINRRTEGYCSAGFLVLIMVSGHEWEARLDQVVGVVWEMLKTES
jgi:hypothetical protein